MSGFALSRARKRRNRTSQRGAAVLEFALIAPILIALLIGIISYGFMLSFRQGMSQAAAEGARSMAVAPASGGDAAKIAASKDAAVQAINRSLESYSVSCSGVDTAGNGTLRKSGTAVGSCYVNIETCPNNGAKDCAIVQVNYYRYREDPLIPSFPGLGVTLPQALEYTAAAEVS